MKRLIVYKYPLNRRSNEIYVPAGALTLCVKIQDKHSLVIWMLVDILAKEEKKEFYVFNTGEDFVQEDGILFCYVGTVQFDNGIVKHVFEKVAFDEGNLENTGTATASMTPSMEASFSPSPSPSADIDDDIPF